MKEPVSVSIVSEMLQLLRKGGHYQPVAPDTPLLPETGNPQVSLGNLHLLDLQAHDMYVGPGGVLVQFVTGEHYLATGFRIGGGPATEALAQYGAEQGFGEYDWLLLAWSALPADYTGQIPTQKMGADSDLNGATKLATFGRQ